MLNTNPKKILLEAANDEELKIIEAFIQEKKIKAFMLEDGKPDANNVFNDMARILIPFLK
jgi:hypothetical protein